MRLHLDALDAEPFAEALRGMLPRGGWFVSTAKGGRVVLEAVIEATDPLDAIVGAQLAARPIIATPVVAIEVTPAAQLAPGIFGEAAERCRDRRRAASRRTEARPGD